MQSEKACFTCRDLKRSFVVQPDASNYGLGAIPLEVFGSTLCPIAHAGHTMQPLERNYFVMEQEYPAIIFALEKFAMYLYVETFTASGDTVPVEYQARTSNANVCTTSILSHLADPKELEEEPP